VMSVTHNTSGSRLGLSPRAGLAHLTGSPTGPITDHSYPPDGIRQMALRRKRRPILRAAVGRRFGRSIPLFQMTGSGIGSGSVGGSGSGTGRGSGPGMPGLGGGGRWVSTNIGYPSGPVTKPIPRAGGVDFRHGLESCSVGVGQRRERRESLDRLTGTVGPSHTPLWADLKCRGRLSCRQERLLQDLEAVSEVQRGEADE
jgi:hypothetical protein